MQSFISLCVRYVGCHKLYYSLCVGPVSIVELSEWLGGSGHKIGLFIEGM